MGDTALFRAVGIDAVPNRYWCLRDGLNGDAEAERIRADLLASEYILVMRAANPHRDRYRAGWEPKAERLLSGEVFELYRLRHDR